METALVASLTRRLTRGFTRRRGLGVLASLGLPRLVFPEPAAARKKCPPCKKRRKGKCKPKPAGTPCTVPSGGICQRGVCACPGGETTCNGVCSNLQADETNCGACGTVCPGNQVCQAGSCFPRDICPAIQTSCSAPLTGITCGGGKACACGPTTEGNIVCVQTRACGSGIPTPCTSSATCPAGEACVEVGSCCPAGHPSHVCYPRCPDTL